MAATDLEQLVVSLSADIKKYENSLNRAQGIANKQVGAIEKRFAAANKNISSSFNNFAGIALKALAVIGGAKGLQTLADAAKNITNALKIAGLSGAALTSTFNQLFAVAQRNAAPIEAVAQLYSRMSLNQKELGASSQQLIGFTDIVGKSLRVSGTSAEAAAGPLLQLSQALGSGTVHAEEFNSILEGMPAFAQAAANGIKQANGSVATLKQLVNSGDISSRALFDGAIAGAADLDAKLQSSQKTIGQALTEMKNSLIKVAGEFDNASGASTSAAGAIEGAAHIIDGLKFDNLIGGIQALISYLNSAAAAASGLVGWLGKVGEANGAVDYAKGMPSNSLGEILAVVDKDRMDAINERITQGAVPASGPLTAAAIQAYAAKNNLGAAPKTNAVVSHTPLPKVDITAAEYKPIATKSGGSGGGKGGGKSKRSDYERDVKSIKERTAALQAETKAQESLNGEIFELEHT